MCLCGGCPYVAEKKSCSCATQFSDLIKYANAKRAQSPLVTLSQEPEDLAELNFHIQEDGKRLNLSRKDVTHKMVSV